MFYEMKKKTQKICWNISHVMSTYLAKIDTYIYLTNSYNIFISPVLKAYFHKLLSHYLIVIKSLISFVI